MLAFAYGCYFNYGGGDCSNNQNSRSSHRRHHRHHVQLRTPECTAEYIWKKNGIRGMFQSPSAFEPKSVMTLAGEWNRAVVVGNQTATEQGECSFDSLQVCKMDTSEIHESRGCFSSMQEIEAYAREEFDVPNVVKHYPDTAMRDLAMTGHQILNITVMKSTYVPGCEHRQVTCHKYEEKGCLTTLCHTVTDTKVFNVWVQPSNVPDGKLVRMMAVCHFSTTAWDKEHISFKVLGKKVGDPVCHFMLIQDFVLCARY
ncbi:unnamed protein product [Adineta steineri]|uniref:BURP domain-containing protein n=1 Tax=Adineta steineri TaxID=433720 RepID=A0A814YYI6_9BILA|nr:unnamed protein product [Adineta steineri]CAF1236381.1 unnamed protein product [Adineta steineri]CAF3498251.1 unnamed protein product [Adineta steineri]CAF4080553.1 unnamed protein product [Adineta steineri]